MEKRVRGFTRAADVWNLPEGEKIDIKLNDLGQAVGKNYKKLVKFLGTLARNGDLAPLTYKNWKVFPAQHKKGMWQLVVVLIDYIHCLVFLYKTLFLKLYILLKFNIITYSFY